MLIELESNSGLSLVGGVHDGKSRSGKEESGRRRMASLSPGVEMFENVESMASERDGERGERQEVTWKRPRRKNSVSSHSESEQQNQLKKERKTNGTGERKVEMEFREVSGSKLHPVKLPKRSDTLDKQDF